MRYTLRRFSVVDSLQGTLLIAPRLHVRITDDLMCRVLESMASHNAGIVESREIIDVLADAGVNIEAGLSFLEKTGIIDLVDGETIGPFERLILITDNLDILQPLQSSLTDDGAIASAVISIEDDLSAVDAENTLVGIFLTRYHPSVIRSIYRQFSSSTGVGFLQAYFYRSEFRIDGLYMPREGSPCHFCHYGRLVNRDRYSFSKGKYSWQAVVDLLDTTKQPIPTSIPLSLTDLHYAMHIFRRRLTLIFGVSMTRVHLDTWFSANVADLITCRVHSEPIAHWHACDCIKGEFQHYGRLARTLIAADRAIC